VTHTPIKKSPAVRGKEGATHENQQAGYQPYDPVDSEVTDPLMSSVSRWERFSAWQ
jgi:hypothetical protein